MFFGLIWVAGALAHVALAQSIIPRTNWTETADNFQTGSEVSRAFDGDSTTFYHSLYTPLTPLPHFILMDTQFVRTVGGLTYLPRQDGNWNGNIGQHTIETSLDGNSWTLVASGTYLDDASQKQTTFTGRQARYVRLTALTEAGNRGSWTSAAEINILTGVVQPPSAPATQGQYSETIDFPLVPVSGTVLPNGKILVWSSYSPSTFGGSNHQTVTAIYDPVTGTASPRTVTNTLHDMFCIGLSLDFTGRVFASGGDDSNHTSTFMPSTNSWNTQGQMRIARGYQSQATTSDGRTFAIGGSWSGGSGNKDGEIYDPKTDAWTALPGCKVLPMQTHDPDDVANGRVFRSDNHAWLFAWTNGWIFQAGPSTAMNWYSTCGTGTQIPVGTRAGDPDSMCGNAVMYDALNGKILTLGGAPGYQNTPATTAAHIITLGISGQIPTAVTINPMNYARSFANAVVLPDGKVFISGGQSYPRPFSDDTAILVSEIWDPATQAFTTVASLHGGRTYHSIALLTMNGTVFSAGGGLCGTGCGTNHYDAEIYTPAYLYNSDGSAATRPVISSVSSSTVGLGTQFTVQANGPVARFAMVRFGSNTHTVDTDQRRMELVGTATGTPNAYSLTLPTDAGIALPGNWMIFVLNAAGVPSVATTILITL